jgi:cyclic pyranopterin phosphate synthase
MRVISRNPAPTGAGRSLAGDLHGRRFVYLRLSVTEVCNFACVYCLPDGYRKSGPNTFVSVAETGALAAAFAGLGVRKVRLTGGEPTTRKDIGAIIARVAGTHGIDKVALTTNGWNLKDKARSFADAGLTHLNVSLDDPDPAGFLALTGKDKAADVLAGVDRALEDGRVSVKLNAVLIGDDLDSRFETFAGLLRHRPISVRFIELMRTADNAAFFDRNHRPGGVLRDWLAARGWREIPREADAGPAVEFVHPEHLGRFGLIAPYAPGFCDTCNRLRVTARGRLRLCLFGTGEVDLRPAMQTALAENDPGALQDLITQALRLKPRAHQLHAMNPGDTANLARFGG